MSSPTNATAATNATNAANRPTCKRSREQVDQELKMAAIAEESSDEYAERKDKYYSKKPLSFLRDQLTPHIIDGNRTNNKIKYAAIELVVLREQYRRRYAAGEFIPVPEKIAFKIDDEPIGEVEMVKCGGKGQLMRVVHPPAPAQPE